MLPLVKLMMHPISSHILDISTKYDDSCSPGILKLTMQSRSVAPALIAIANVIRIRGNVIFVLRLVIKSKHLSCVR